MSILASEYFPFLAFGAFVLPVFAWTEWQLRIRPLLIPCAEIERMADAMTDAYGERARDMTSLEEYRAWRYSQPFEQGRWRRIGRALERRGNCV